MSNLAKSATGLMVATMLAKVLGFGRELALASAYGTSNYSDAYLVALNIPTVVFASIGASLGTSYIPVYYDTRKKLGKEKSNLFTNNILNIVVIICMVIGVLGAIFTKDIVKLFAMGFEGETLNIAIDFTKIMILGVVFIGASYLLTAYLQANDNFIVPGLISIPYNVLIILFIFISTKGNPYIVAYGTLLSMASQVLFQLPFAYKQGYKYIPYINLKDENIKKLLILLAPMFIGIAVDQINMIVDRTLASTLVEGSISALNYANKLNGFVMGLFIASIGAVIYPMLSRLSSENENEKFEDTVIKSINSVVLLVMPVSVGAIFLSKPIVSILFKRGAFDENAVNMTAIALVFYSLGMVAFGIRDILTRVFYSIKDTKIPVVTGVISMILNIVLNIILIKYMEHAGLALGTSIAAILSVILMFISLNKKMGNFGQNQIFIVLAKSILSSVVMGIVALQIHSYLYKLFNDGFIENVICLGISIFSGALSYIILVLILKIEEVNLVLDIIKKKIKK